MVQIPHFSDVILPLMAQPFMSEAPKSMKSGAKLFKLESMIGICLWSLQHCCNFLRKRVSLTSHLARQTTESFPRTETEWRNVCCLESRSNWHHNTKKTCSRTMRVSFMRKTGFVKLLSISLMLGWVGLSTSLISRKKTQLITLLFLQKNKKWW